MQWLQPLPDLPSWSICLSKQSQSFYSQPDSHLPSAPAPARNPCDCFRDDFSEPQAIAPASSEFSVAQLKQVFLPGCIDFTGNGKGNKRCPIHLYSFVQFSKSKYVQVIRSRWCECWQVFPITATAMGSSILYKHASRYWIFFSSANLRVHMSSQRPQITPGLFQGDTPALWFIPASMYLSQMNIQYTDQKTVLKHIV